MAMFKDIGTFDVILHAVTADLVMPQY